MGSRAEAGPPASGAPAYVAGLAVGALFVGRYDNLPGEVIEGVLWWGPDAAKAA